MMERKTHCTTDHDTIRRWAEDRGGSPAIERGIVKGTEHIVEPRILLEEETADETVEEVSWERFFDEFDDEGLVFVYEEHAPDGGPSEVHQFVDGGLLETAMRRGRVARRAKSTRGRGAAVRAGRGAAKAPTRRTSGARGAAKKAAPVPTARAGRAPKTTPRRGRGERSPSRGAGGAERRGARAPRASRR